VTGKDGYRRGAGGFAAPQPEKKFRARNPRTPNFRRFVCFSTFSLFFSSPHNTCPVSATGDRLIVCGDEHVIVNVNEFKGMHGVMLS